MGEPRKPTLAVFLIGFFLLLAALTVLGFLLPWMPPVATKHGEGVDFLIHYLLVTTGAIFVLGHGVLAWLLWRHSGDSPATYRPLSPKIEWAWALVPVLVMTILSEAGVLLLGLPVWGEVYGKVPPDAVEVEVVGKQFEWLVRYPGKDGSFGRVAPDLVHETRNPLGLDERDPQALDDIVLRGTLHLPAGRTASVRLRSHDVLHSFTVPEFRVKQDVVPGFTAHTQFQPVRTGQYEIACAELCGLGHYRMRGFVFVKTREEFTEWLSQQVGWFE